MPVVFEVERLDSLLNDSLNLVRLDSFDQGVELDSLLYCQLGEDGIVLGTVSDQLARLLELSLHIITLDRDLASGWRDLSCQRLEGR